MSKESENKTVDITEKTKSVILPTFDIRFVMQRRRTSISRMENSMLFQNQRGILRNRKSFRQ